MADSLQDRVFKAYEYVKDNAYLCWDDVEINNLKFNSTLLFGLLTSLVRGKELILGEPGLGKTTSSENILSLMYSYPKEVILASTLKGNPELTEEKMIGRPDLGELNAGRERVIWSNFVLIAPKILDELNRIPPSKQNVLLEGIDRGNWKYLNEILDINASAMYLTSNYKDSGNNDIIPPLLDRIDIAVESKHPGINNMRYWSTKFLSDDLSNKELSKKILHILNSERDIGEMIKKIQPIKDEYRLSIEKLTGLSLFSDNDLKNIYDAISSTKVSKDGLMFRDLALAELTSCQVYGQKRTNEECKEGCHYKDFMCAKTYGCLSMRSFGAVIKYSAALAWLLGDSIVGPQHIGFVLPYAMWHKTKFKQDYSDSMREDARNDPVDLYVAKKSVEEIKQRFTRNYPNQKQMIEYLAQNNIKDAQTLAADKDHPVFREYLSKL